ncbi:hypothetical protein IHE55_05990 [Streptomyces pactum]|uniref:Small hydrophilic protein n=1 Tax=Streptomyces pactum TaxID=68249 RepID=A0ABS0NGQ6_9ACTN|nr:hypothetical protein [Streptomyces pactum]MBH5334375.1 hypothetical protein [Streptomyces pactum]
MAKNKNRERGKSRSRSSAERADDQARQPEDRAEQLRSQLDRPSGSAKGRQKKFGHN